MKIRHYSCSLFVSFLSYRTLYEFDLNEVVDVYDFITSLFYCLRKSFEYLNSPKFQFVKSGKLSDLCSKIYKKITKLKCY